MAIRKLIPLLALMLLAGCGPKWTVQRWRVTVEVETPEGLATGSSVVEIRKRPRNELIYTMDSAQHQVRGEAVAVDLPQGTLFALVSYGGEYGFYRGGQMTKAAWVPGSDGLLRRVEDISDKSPDSRAVWKAKNERFSPLPCRDRSGGRRTSSLYAARRRLAPLRAPS